MAPRGSSARTPNALSTVAAIASKAGASSAERVAERRRAVALARHFRKAEGLSDYPDRRAPRPITGDRQGLLLRPDRREGTAGQGPLCRRVPRLRRVHAAAQRQRGRVRVLQALSSRRDRAQVDAGAGDLGNARVARALRPAAVVLRLVAHAHAPARGCCARAAGPWRIAGRERCQQPVRNLGCRAGCGLRGDFDAPRTAASEAVELIGHTGGFCAQSTEIGRKIRTSEEVRQPAQFR